MNLHHSKSHHYTVERPQRPCTIDRREADGGGNALIFRSDSLSSGYVWEAWVNTSQIFHGGSSGVSITAPSMKLENLLGASQWIRHRGLYAKFEQNQPTRLACGGCYRFGRCTSYIMGTSVIHLLFGLLGSTYGCVSGLFLRISFNFTSFSCGKVALWVCSSIRRLAAFCLTRNKLMSCIRPCF